MSRDALSLQLDEGDAPAFLRIAQAVMRDVRRGRLKPGQKLPGSRTWAKHLGFHRNTVLAALTELEAQGWVTTVQAQGMLDTSTSADPDGGGGGEGEGEGEGEAPGCGGSAAVLLPTLVLLRRRRR